ncbi:MAG TPA: NADH-quinone oxidoreductase subunit I [Deferrisomatales bacterium]|nr:NADH-quinone oxidoreductase subunit I [Deferrisomatales bacterium]
MINYFKQIFAGLWSLLVGMRLTLGYTFAPTVTVHYPFETLPISPNFRGHIDLVIDPKTGKDTCITCMSCVRACPSGCIELAGEKPEGAKKKVLTEYRLDFTKCSLCANCVETCPTNALEFSQDYQLAGLSRHEFHFDLVQRFRDRCREMGVEPNIADLTPVPPKEPKPAAEGEGGEEKPVKKVAKKKATEETPETAEDPSQQPKQPEEPPAES